MHSLCSVREIKHFLVCRFPPTSWMSGFPVSPCWNGTIWWSLHRCLPAICQQGPIAKHANCCWVLRGHRNSCYCSTQVRSLVYEQQFPLATRHNLCFYVFGWRFHPKQIAVHHYQPVSLYVTWKCAPAVVLEDNYVYAKQVTVVYKMNCIGQSEFVFHALGLVHTECSFAFCCIAFIIVL